MKKLISTGLAALMLASALTACTPAPVEDSASASADGIAKYTAYLEDNLAEMPDQLVLATAENSATYGVDMTNFAADGYVTRADAGNVVILGKTDEGLDRAVRDFVKYGNEDNYSKVYGEGYRVKKLTIAGNDISDYAVVRDDEDYNGNLALAASELVSYIEKTCGAKITAYSASEYAAIADKPAKTITLTIDYPAHGNEAFTIEVADDGNLTIYGGRVRGCLYGVYDLLEQDIGWRFMDDVLTVFDVGGKKTIEYLYESEHVDLTSEINRTEEPFFESRRMDDPHECSYNIGNKERIAANWYSGHGLNQVDYTGTSYEGMEDSGNQPCLNDEEILTAIDNHVLTRTQAALDAGQVIGRDFFGLSLGQYDGPAPCSCNTCREVLRIEKSRSGAVIRMANRAAQLLKDNGYDGAHINVLAYMDTDTPPAVTVPLDNVRVAYCFYLNGDHYTCNAHTIDGKDCYVDSSASNVEFAEKFEKWVEICAPGNLDVWYYPFHCYNATLQAPMITNLYADIKYLADHGVGAIINTVFSRISGGLIQALTAYLLNEICWQFPETYEEFDAMIREWFFITYGDGWESLYEYFTQYEKMGKLNGCYIVFHGWTHPKRYVSNEYMAENFDYFYELFEEAKSLADTEYQYRLIERYESGMLWMCLGSSYEQNYTNGTAEERALFKERYEELHRIFTEYRLPIYRTVSDKVVYAPELDFEVNPFDWLEGVHG